MFLWTCLCSDEWALTHLSNLRGNNHSIERGQVMLKKDYEALAAILKRYDLPEGLLKDIALWLALYSREFNGPKFWAAAKKEG